jgi:hypothetical protein
MPLFFFHTLIFFNFGFRLRGDIRNSKVVLRSDTRRNKTKNSFGSFWPWVVLLLHANNFEKVSL